MDVRSVLAAQAEMYGEPLGTWFRRLIAAYGISQARLADALGLSPPMLSQLMSGQRAKISNPAVLGRLVRLEELAAAAAADPALRERALDEVRESRPALTTSQLSSAPPDLARALAEALPAATLHRAATEVSDPDLARILGAAAQLAP